MRGCGNVDSDLRKRTSVWQRRLKVNLYVIVFLTAHCLTSSVRSREEFSDAAIFEAHFVFGREPENPRKGIECNQSPRKDSESLERRWPGCGADSGITHVKESLLWDSEAFVMSDFGRASGGRSFHRILCDIFSPPCPVDLDLLPPSLRVTSIVSPLGLFRHSYDFF